MSPSQLAAWRARTIGFVFQSYNLLPVLTAQQNVELPLLLTNLGKKDRAERTAIALASSVWRTVWTTIPRQLSGGQEQRVAIARAIVADPTLILLDEPTGQLDSKSSDEVLELLRRLNEEFHKTIMMVTHDAKAASRAKTVLHLEKGVLLERPRKAGGGIDAPARWGDAMKFLPLVLANLQAAQAAHDSHHVQRGARAVPVRLAAHRRDDAQRRLAGEQRVADDRAELHGVRDPAADELRDAARSRCRMCRR